jgi:hypothetical protein
MSELDEYEISEYDRKRRMRDKIAKLLQKEWRNSAFLAPQRLDTWRDAADKVMELVWNKRP